MTRDSKVAHRIWLQVEAEKNQLNSESCIVTVQKNTVEISTRWQHHCTESMQATSPTVTFGVSDRHANKTRYKNTNTARNTNG